MLKIKNNKFLKIFIFLIILSIILIISGIFLMFSINSKSAKDDQQPENNKKEEIIVSSSKYVCIKELNLSTKKVVTKYETTVNQDNEITHFYGEKKYIFDDEINYANWLHSTDTRNVDYDSNYDELTITIYIANGEILDENGEVIFPNYLEYINNYVDDDYECKFIEK